MERLTRGFKNLVGCDIRFCVLLTLDLNCLHTRPIKKQPGKMKSSLHDGPCVCLFERVDLLPSTTIPLIILFLLGLSGCLGHAARNSGTRSPDSIEALRSRLSSVRGLKFVDEVPMVVETRERMADYIDNEVRQNMGKKTLEDVSLAYAKLGLLPRGIDLRASLLSFYSSQTLAFYDSRAKKVFLAANPDGGSGTAILGKADEKVIVHELTHALQDQHFSLGSRLRALDNGDKALALRSIAEGDAVLTEYAYSFGGVSEWLSSYIRQICNPAVEGAILPGTPALIRDKMLFQYRAGTTFLSHFLGKNSWFPINLIYKYPPLSTEQILHPEKYSAAPDPPTRITLKSLSGLFSAEWREIENNTLGELLVQCLFKQFLPPAGAAAVANGWDGDRLVAYRNGEEVAFIWATVWDSPKDAEEFYEKYQEIRPMKNGTGSVDSRFYIEKRDRTVIVVEGLERDRIKGNIETVWLGMVLEEEPFQPPPFSSWIDSR
jgi:hypothetical protein